MKRVFSGLLCCVAATAVLAHAHLKTAVPADGATVNAAPPQVVLNFSEPAHLTACWLQKEDGPKQKIADLPTTPSARITVPLPRLEPGVYVLSWRVVGDDTHIVPGRIRFTVAPAGH
ncbi:MAG TPA: copper resistance CopC family protein [Steroidobacteraceae bacterium]|nr:copper resistance CopC family protein [Steroidobacteraceae bacterium]